MDTVEGNTSAENADALVGSSFGSESNPLFNDTATWSEVGSVGGAYSQSASSHEQFSIDGGAAQSFDSAAVYNATITYADGTTETITAVVAQDTDGNTYLAPEMSDNADQAALDAKPIQSVELDSLAGSNYSGLSADRADWEVATCFVEGTQIRTLGGEAPIEDLEIGDLIPTMDHGAQPIRWIGCRTVPGHGRLAPVEFVTGALGNTRNLRVSPQHRMLLSGHPVELHAGYDTALAAATHLVNGRTIRRVIRPRVTYYHLLFDAHEVIWSEGCLTESFHPGATAWSALEEASRDEILALFPELGTTGLGAYGPTAHPVLQAHQAAMSLPFNTVS